MYIGGLDVGTTGCKIAVYDETGTLFQTYYREYPAVFSGGAHEIDFDGIRRGVLELLQQACREFPLKTLGVTSFGETFVLLDENDAVLAPSMLYTDPRGEEECAQLQAALGAARLTEIAGVKPHAMYSIYKLMWLQKNRPELFARCRRVLLGQDFIVYALTGRAQIDFSLAARTGAFDIRQNGWSEEIFAAAGLNSALFAQPVPSGTVAGPVKKELCRQLGIGEDLVIVSACHDQAAAMLGAGIFKSAQAMNGTGTVECIPVLMDHVPEDPRLFEGGYAVVPYPAGGYACYAFSFTGGAALKWFRGVFAQKEQEEAGQKNVYALLDARISDAPTGLLVLPHFAGAATPYMDYGAKAAIVGLTMESTKYDIYKALMEGTSYEMRLNFDHLSRFIPPVEEIRATGGGASSDVWLQIKADILGTPITALSCGEIGAAGTAAVAGKAVGAFYDFSIVQKMAPVRRVFLPDAGKHSEYQALYQKYTRLYSAVKAVEGRE